MFHYVEDKEFLRRVRGVCGELMQDFCHTLKDAYDIGANFCLVGSGARNLIVQNASEPIDLDYNLEIDRCVDFEDCRAIKACAKKAFDKALAMHGWGHCEDSTSALTTKRRYLTHGNRTAFSIDVCIVAADEDGQTARLIHEKTGYVLDDRYYWNIAPHSAQIREKADCIKKSGQWADVREQYLRLKNMYMMRNDRSHPSFVCYIEAVNNVYCAAADRRRRPIWGMTAEPRAKAAPPFCRRSVLPPALSFCRFSILPICLCLNRCARQGTAGRPYKQKSCGKSVLSAAFLYFFKKAWVRRPSARRESCRRPG